MGEVVDIESKQPHLVVHASDAAHVIPLSLLDDVAKGAKPSAILTEPVVRRIIEEWLQQVTA
ncbi:hypothetical protein KH389_06280 [Pseudomonas qingdaonensis]|uniref:Uncharacterized protein n=1 Tax=Pseudomonas qingdaonensis TaxID=2056231 RepID=A0ABX8DV56_9PSED|nr:MULTISPECIES: hypothetical protein [Pseudomonas]QVL20195.1 hypothetical protein KH389_06280 [Pseudomonas qingdaonensis]